MNTVDKIDGSISKTKTITFPFLSKIFYVQKIIVYFFLLIYKHVLSPVPKRAVVSNVVFELSSRAWTLIGDGAAFRVAMS